MPVVDTSTCAQSYARFSANSRTPIIISGHQICVQGTTNRDTCQGKYILIEINEYTYGYVHICITGNIPGDSGGPLMMEERSSGRFLLVGLVSFGPRACGVSNNLPGVYTKISSYIEWIARNI